MSTIRFTVRLNAMYLCHYYLYHIIYNTYFRSDMYYNNIIIIVGQNGHMFDSTLIDIYNRTS